MVALFVIVALALGAVAARGIWNRRAGAGPRRLDLLYAAHVAFESGRLDQASKLLDRRAKETQPTALDWMLRARIAEAKGQPSDALGFLAKVPDTDPLAAQARLQAGQAQRARYRAREAETEFRRALALDPDLVQAYRELAYLYATQRRKAECDELMRALADRKPLDVILAFAWCQNYCGIWDPYAATKALEPFVAADPEDRNSRLALAEGLRLSNRADEVEDVLSLLPAHDPDAIAVRLEIAMDRGDMARAEELARKGPADHPLLNTLRGQLALAHKDFPRAAACFRSALKHDPEQRDALHGLATALHAMGDPEAVAYEQNASRQDQLKRMIQGSVSTLSKDPQLFVKLGQQCESLGRHAEARTWYGLAIRQDPLNHAAQQALALLDQRTAREDHRKAP